MRNLLLLLASIWLFPPVVYSQLSLGETARQLRESKVEATGSTAAPVGAQHDQADQFLENVVELFSQGRFHELDQLAATVRSRKARFEGGGWRLYTFYKGVSNPPDTSAEADWENLLQRLRKWVGQNPDSITAHVALAQAYVNYAWHARTDKSGSEVTDEQWKMFGERLALARSTLDEASALEEKCPQWYWVMQTVALGQHWDNEQDDRLFQQAIAFDPDYYYYYQQRAYYLLPKWYGNEGDTEQFADQLANDIGGERGSAMYYQIAANAICHCADETTTENLSWAKIQQGYAALEKLYGTSNLNLNEFTYIAFQKKDPKVARDAFSRIGEDWNPTTWKTKEYFDRAKAWAERTANDLETAAEAVRANLKTPEGQQYDAQFASFFQEKFATSLKECVEQGGTDLRNFDLFLLITEQGVPQRYLPDSKTAVSSCLMHRVQQLQFPRPPKGNYWVKVTMTIVP